MNTLIDMNTLKRCNACNTDNPLSIMVYDKSVKGGYRPLCRKCKSDQKAALKAKSVVKAKKELALKPSHFGASVKPNPTQRRSLGLGTYVGARFREPNEALPYSINKMIGVYKPDSWNGRVGSDDHLQYKSLMSGGSTVYPRSHK